MLVQINKELPNVRNTRLSSPSPTHRPHCMCVLCRCPDDGHATFVMTQPRREYYSTASNPSRAQHLSPQTWIFIYGAVAILVMHVTCRISTYMNITSWIPIPAARNTFHKYIIMSVSCTQHLSLHKSVVCCFHTEVWCYNPNWTQHSSQTSSCHIST